MMERNTGVLHFQKKIVPYLDGSLSSEEVSEFEAFVSTHPEFEKQIKNKKNEIQLLRDMIPQAVISYESRESIHNEMRASVFNLLKEEPKSFFDGLRVKWEDWINR